MYHVLHSLLVFVHYYYVLLTTVRNLLLHARLLLLFNKLYCIVLPTPISRDRRSQGAPARTRYESWY